MNQHVDKHSVNASPPARATALQRLLVEKNLLTDSDVHAQIEAADDLSEANGARVIARAWIDPGFRIRLLENATTAARELGIEGPEGKYMVAVENTEQVHNVIVCTQCSCTAWPLIGLPPDWYKSPAYRARVVREARTVLQEMGLAVAHDRKIRVWDTSGDARYVVLPLRPASAADFSEEQLQALVTREAMIGVAEINVGHP